MYTFDKDKYIKRLGYIQNFLDKAKVTHIPQSVLLQNENKHRLSFIVSSTAIEGNTFTIDETKKLLDQNIVSDKRTYYEHQQIKNFHSAYNEMLELSAQSKPLSIELICELHAFVCAGEIKSAGRLREESVYVGDKTCVIHTPTHHEKVSVELQKAIDGYLSSDDDIIIRIAEFHLEFEKIHPFVDGNGRVGRLIMNYQLLQHDYFQIHIPNNKRKLYMTAFKDYNRTKKTDKMLDIISREEEKTIQSIDKLIEKNNAGKDTFKKLVDDIANGKEHYINTDKNNIER